MVTPPFRDRTIPASGVRLRYFASFAVLVLALLVTLALRVVRTDYVEEQVVDRQERVVRVALDEIERDFTQRQRVLMDRARQIARERDVVIGLRQLARDELDRPTLAGRLLDHLKRNGDVEVYDMIPRLVAWHGISMPLDDAPSRLQFLDRSQVSITVDEDWRSALVVWWPVRDGRRPIGAIRAMELLDVRVPVQNEFLRHETLARTWRYATGRPVRVALGSDVVNPNALGENSRILQGLDGTPLGVVTVEPPSESEVRAGVARRYDDAAALWITLLALWVVGGLWYAYRRSAHPWMGVAAAAAVGISWWGLRGVLLLLDVPARWQGGKAPLAPLFDPTRLASTAGFGLLRSAGDVVVTSVFAVLFAGFVVHWMREYVQTNRHGGGLVWRRPGIAGLALTGFFSSAVVLALVALLTGIARLIILDSTLDYFARSGIFPGPQEWLVALVFASLLLFTLAFLMLSSAILGWWLRLIGTYQGSPIDPRVAAGVVAVALVLPVIAVNLIPAYRTLVPWPAAIAFLIVSTSAGYMFFLRRGEGYRLLTLRGVLMGVFILAVLLYPMYYSGMDAKRRIQMADAAESFEEGRDPRILFGIEQVLEQVGRHPRVDALLQWGVTAASRASLDSLADQVMNNTMLASLGPYDVRVSIMTSGGEVAGRNVSGDRLVGRSKSDEVDAAEFEILHAMYHAAGDPPLLIDRITGRVERDRIQYVGIAPISTSSSPSAGWVMARVEPQSLFQFSDMPFPRVLLPPGLLGDIHGSLSLAEFQNGILVRSLGRTFGRYRLADDVRQRVVAQAEYWTRETVEETPYLTYYRRKEVAPPAAGAATVLRTSSPGVVAVRVAATNTFDHLYYLLRLTVAGLLLGIPLHLIGVLLRWHVGLLPAERVSFRDKVLNAFLSVGIISVAAVGFVGGQVVAEGTEASVRSLLRQHLERVEQTLALEARGSELPYRTLDRIGLDSLSARAGVDLNVYRGWDLASTSRPQLIRDRLLDTRLPADAYVALYHDGYRFATSTEHIGTFEYKAGYRTLLDEEGVPRYVVSVPILPEQERIEEEQARTIAYLFGALLILILVVMLTASVLANAISRPIARLRAGLEAVARGRFERSIPVQTRDEVGELVETFNTMQEQLAESRRKLAQQERQLAWREMARQVAHEIKNPLTPMKLSVQHLRRAFENGDAEDTNGARTKSGKFAAMFERVTGTLIEQINTLARIADEFSSYAKLPTRVQEELDLNAVIEQAVDLMREEQGAEVVLRLSDEPLILSADREELRRVYINLIKNAIQSVPEDRNGLVVVESRVDVSPAGEREAFSTVRDNGAGIPADLRERIFEPNFSTKTSGMGLGLAIVRRSIEEMHGEIGFETEEDSGTTFWIRLPLLEDDANGE